MGDEFASPSTHGLNMFAEDSRAGTLLSVERLTDVPSDPDIITDRLRDRGRVAALEWHDVDGGWDYVVPWPTPLPVGEQPLATLDRFCRRTGLEPTAERDPAVPAFTGGLVVAVGYELGGLLEPRSAPNVLGSTRPVLRALVAEVVVAVHASRGEVLVVARPLVDGREELENRVAAVIRALRRPVTPAPAWEPEPQTVASSFDPGAYRAAVATALGRIASGDVYQVNLSQRLRARWGGDVHGLYRALRAHSPAPHGAVLDMDGSGLASVSPETFLRAVGRDVATRPIKGTRPRANDPVADRRLATALRASDKDRAENVMIVDLLRNDLGRVCEVGSVAVPDLTTLEGHPTVWHLVSTITGRLRSTAGWGDLLRATFPCGSVTGAPKIAAMRLIDELEPVARSWYCGAFGYLSAGTAHLAVAIRTATLHRDGSVDYGAGGGIVADSDPAAEHAESLDKAAPFLRAVGADA